MAPRKVLLSNPAAGARVAAEVLVIVRQLLAQAEQTFIEYQTDSPQYASKLGADLYAQLVAEKDRATSLTVILLGGDGTTQEFLSGLCGISSVEGTGVASLLQLPHIRLILIPTGTANALYSALYPPLPSSRHEALEDDSQHGWRLRSLRGYLRSLEPTNARAPARLYPLTLASTTVTETDAPPRQVITHLITSHALHAAILLDSEKLRESHPGIERFKIAAEKNLIKWIDGRLVLKRGKGNAPPLQRYDPKARGFTDLEGDEAVVDGPFFYMVSMTTDRLEPSFVPAPFGFAEVDTGASGGSPASYLSRPAQCLDIVLIRPTKDPQVRLALPEALGATAWEESSTLGVRQTFVEKRVGSIIQGMYKEGNHVHLLYPGVEGEEGGELSEEGEGESLVDYWRVGKWEWTPRSGSNRAGLVCLDGALIESTGTSSRVLTELDGKVQVYY